MKKELVVRALENGTVIDHIPADKLFQIVNILHLDTMTDQITIGNNLDSNKLGKKGSLADAVKGADIFVGVSSPGLLTKEMVASMNKGAIVMPMANPTPEIMPDLALEAGAAVVGTGRSDFPNQINNVLAFPGIFRGALDCRATDINEEMKIAAAKAIASLVSCEELKADYIIPAPFDKRVAPTVAEAVKQAAIKTGVNRI